METILGYYDKAKSWYTTATNVKKYGIIGGVLVVIGVVAYVATKGKKIIRSPYKK